MKKVLVIVFAMVGLTVFFACNKESEAVGDDALTRGANVNDSTKQGGVTITINDEWAGDTTVHF